MCGTIDGYNQLLIYRINKNNDYSTQYKKVGIMQFSIYIVRVAAIINYGVVGLAITTLFQTIFTTVLLRKNHEK
jgi:hypothetical protein